MKTKALQAKAVKREPDETICGSQFTLDGKTVGA
jgi:hypothetical protein